MKRFWKSTAAVPAPPGWAIELDGRPVRTPARALLQLPDERLALAIAAEWNEAGETVDPRAMPLTGLANAAIDHIAPDRDAFAAGLAHYGESDLLYYRAEAPEPLVKRQASAWNPLLSWARRRFDVDFVVTEGVSPVEQPTGTIARLAQATAAFDAFALAGLAPLVTIGGSLITALAVAEEAATPEKAWDAVTIDERWQLETWGSDPEAVSTLDTRRRDFLAGARFLDLLR